MPVPAHLPSLRLLPIQRLSSTTVAFLTAAPCHRDNLTPIRHPDRFAAFEVRAETNTRLCDCRNPAGIPFIHGVPTHYCARCQRTQGNWEIRDLIDGPLIQYGHRRLFVCGSCHRIQDEYLISHFGGTGFRGGRIA